MLLTRMLGTDAIVHCESVVSSSPGHENASPVPRMCTSPCGCSNPRPRPGTMGIGSCSLLMRVKSATWTRRSVACSVSSVVSGTTWEDAHLGVEECRVGGVSDARRAVRDGLDVHA